MAIHDISGKSNFKQDSEKLIANTKNVKEKDKLARLSKN